MDSLHGSCGLFNLLQTDGIKHEKSEDKVKIWVLRCGRTYNVHYLEAYKDFVDLLLGILMLRTGALIRLNRAVAPALEQVRTSGGIHGLYDSFKSLEDSLVIVDKNILLDPFQTIKVTDELQSLESSDFECCNMDCSKFLSGSRQVCRRCTVATHFSCILCGGYFPENAHTSLCYTPWKPWRNHMTAAPVLTRYTVVQGSSPTTNERAKKEGYVKTNIPYIITNDLNVSPLSTFNVSEVLKKGGAGNCDDLECFELSIGTTEILVLMCAALTSPTPLTDIFGNMCNKQTKVRSSASISSLPCFRKKSERKLGSCDHDGSSAMEHDCKNDQKDKQGKKDKQSCFRKKNAKDSCDPTPSKLPPRVQVEEQAIVSRPPEYVLRGSELLSKPPDYLLKGSESTRKQPNVQIPREMSVLDHPSDSISQEPQPNCLGDCSSKQKKSTQQPPQRLPFQQQFGPSKVPSTIATMEGPLSQHSYLGFCSSPQNNLQLHDQMATQPFVQSQPTAMEDPNAQPNCAGPSSSFLLPQRRQSLEEIPMQSSSCKMQLVSNSAPQRRIVPKDMASSSYSNVPSGLLNSKNQLHNQQSVEMEQHFQDSRESTAELPFNHQATCSTHLPPALPHDAVGNCTFSRTPKPTTSMQQPTTLTSFPQSSLSIPTVQIKSRSILNPLFRERPPSHESSTKSSQPSTSNVTSIGHRSNEQHEPKPRIRGIPHAIQLGKNLAGIGLRSLSSVAAAFEQGPIDYASCSDDDNNASERSYGDAVN